MKVRLKERRKMNRFKNFLLNANSTNREVENRKSICRRNFMRLNGVTTTNKALISLALVAFLASPLWADTLFFATGSPNGALGALSQRPSPGNVETETADDFLLQETTVITHATIFGLLPVGTPLDNIKDV